MRCSSGFLSLPTIFLPGGLEVEENEYTLTGGTVLWNFFFFLFFSSSFASLPFPFPFPFPSLPLFFPFLLFPFMLLECDVIAFLGWP